MEDDIRAARVFVTVDELIVVMCYGDSEEFLTLSVEEARRLCEDLRRAAAIVDPNMD